MHRVSRDACVSVCRARACIRVWSARCRPNSEPKRMHILHGKEPPYLTGQSHLIDTRRIPNTSRPPVRYPFLSLLSLILSRARARGITESHLSHAALHRPPISRRRLGPIMEMEILHTRVTPHCARGGCVAIING